MRYRPLGKTGLTVSEIGFGGWGIGGPSPGATSYGPTDDAVSLRTLERAFEQGITLYDTSNAYGDGHSEALIGQAFKQRRTQVVIATKAGFPRFDQDQDFSPGQLRASLEGSLRRLQTDHVDLFQLHSPPIALLRDDPAILATLRSLVQEGKARAFGLSVRAPEDGLVAIRELGFPVVQVNLNLLDQRAVGNGLTEVQVGRLSNLLCTDRGRAINQQEAGWENTLTGLPKELYEFWQQHLQSRGYKIKYEIVDFPNGMPGDIGITLSWK